MKKFLPFLGIIVILIIGVLIYQNLIKKEEEALPEEKVSMPEKALEGKSIAMIIAFRDFRDEEYFTPREILEKAGAEIKTASNKMGRAIGADGGDVEIDFLVSELNPADFAAMVFIGGPGALKHLDNEDSYKIARQAVSQDKVLAAICIAPVILAKAGILAGKKATVWTNPMDKSAVKILEDKNAVFEEKPVVVDGKIVTGNGPAAAEKFGQAIIEVLTGK